MTTDKEPFELVPGTKFFKLHTCASKSNSFGHKGHKVSATPCSMTGTEMTVECTAKKRNAHGKEISAMVPNTTKNETHEVTEEGPNADPGPGCMETIVSGSPESSGEKPNCKKYISMFRSCFLF